MPPTRQPGFNTVLRLMPALDLHGLPGVHILDLDPLTAHLLRQLNLRLRIKALAIRIRGQQLPPQVSQPILQDTIPFRPM